MGYSYVDLDSSEPAGPGGVVRFVRRELSATAFGFNHFTLPPGAEGREHDEAETGQEEVMIVLSGRFVRIDPETTRLPVAGPEGLAFVTVGAPREAPYVARGPF
jgi:hypothetical protein